MTSPPRADDVRIDGSVAPGGEIVELWCAASDLPVIHASTVGTGGARFPATRPPRAVSAQVTVSGDDGHLLTVPVDALPVAHPVVQMLPDNRILVVGRRCRWRPDRAERNAVVYAGDGTMLDEITVGDGVREVLTTAGGEVWVGYTDEGVVGTFGWGSNDAPVPIGTPGLNRFSSTLQLLWSYPYRDARHRIEACCALTVAGEDAWLYVRPGSQIIRVRHDRATSWSTGVDGARALTVTGNRVALYGGYPPDRGRLMVGELEERGMRPTGRYRLATPGGRLLPELARAVGRGPCLHLWAEGRWWWLDLRDVSP